jgi:hypothetical protein
MGPGPCCLPRAGTDMSGRAWTVFRRDLRYSRAAAKNQRRPHGRFFALSTQKWVRMSPARRTIGFRHKSPRIPKRHDEIAS